MKKTVLAMFATAFIAIPCFSQTVADEVQVTKEGREVFATIAKWADAVKSRNAKDLDALFAEDLIITSYDGKTRGKAEELEILKPNPNVRTVSIKNEDVKVRVFGSVALVTALSKMHFLINEKDVHSAFRYTAVFVKENEKWRLAALQTARAPQEQPPAK